MISILSSLPTEGTIKLHNLPNSKPLTLTGDTRLIERHWGIPMSKSGRPFKNQHLRAGYWFFFFFFFFSKKVLISITNSYSSDSKDKKKNEGSVPMPLFMMDGHAQKWGVKDIIPAETVAKNAPTPPPPPFMNNVPLVPPSNSNTNARNNNKRPLP